MVVGSRLAETAVELTKNNPKKIKSPVSDRCVDENAVMSAAQITRSVEYCL